ncbi:hypothetical protein F5Y15DRAFT_390794 [Xylariaceae sp. FL0016]|nr:hypothetical protein F5Y15DRAFT_390794 [Xylariaceae sp. FL0016]
MSTSPSRTTKMCECSAFYYAKCKRSCIKFVPTKTCLIPKLGLGEKCIQKIVNGNPNVPRDFPTTDDICSACYPHEANVQEEERAVEQAKRMRSNSIKWLVSGPRA